MSAIGSEGNSNERTGTFTHNLMNGLSSIQIGDGMSIENHGSETLNQTGGAINVGNNLNGFFTKVSLGDTVGSASANALVLGQSGSNLILTAVPEPTRALLLVIATLGVCLRRRR